MCAWRQHIFLLYAFAHGVKMGSGKKVSDLSFHPLREAYPWGAAVERFITYSATTT